MATRPKAVPDQPTAGDRDDPRSHPAEPDEHRFIAPDVGPDDPRRFTDSGIEIERVYEETDVEPGLPERLGEPGAYPFTRGIHDGHVPRPAVDDAPVRRLREPRGHQRALPLPDRARLDGPVDGVRPPDTARARLRRPAGARRGRPHRRPDRHDRGHADLLRPDTARRGLDLDDDQRPGGDPAAALRARRRGAGRRAPTSCAARSRTTSSRSTCRAGTTSIPPRRRCG